MKWWWQQEKETAQPVQIVQPVLKPGECECGYPRCCHRNGMGGCCAAFCRNDAGEILPKNQWGTCACQIFILDDEDDDDDSEPDPVDPEVKELERMKDL